MQSRINLPYFKIKFNRNFVAWLCKNKHQNFINVHSLSLIEMINYTHSKFIYLQTFILTPFNVRSQNNKTQQNVKLDMCARKA